MRLLSGLNDGGSWGALLRVQLMQVFEAIYFELLGDVDASEALRDLLFQLLNTDAFLPAPVMMTTRTSGSAVKSSITSAAERVISRDIAFKRSGLLNVSVPTPSFFADSILPSSLMGLSDDSLLIVLR